jgi:hypothetical protein
LAALAESPLSFALNNRYGARKRREFIASEEHIAFGQLKFLYLDTCVARIKISMIYGKSVAGKREIKILARHPEKVKKVATIREIPASK